MVIGDPKVGKSSFVAAWSEVMPDVFDPFIIPLMPGLEGLSVNTPIEACPGCEGSGCDTCSEPPGPGFVRKILTKYADVQKWSEWATAQPQFNPIVFDDVNSLHNVCMDEIELRESCEFIAEIKQGIGWFKATDLFVRLLSPIRAAQKSIVLICHIHYEKIRMGTYERTKPLPQITGKRTAEFINKLTDISLHFTAEGDGDDRKMMAYLKPGEKYLGGDRYSHLGFLPDEFDRGKSAKEAAKKFLSYWYDL